VQQVEEGECPAGDLDDEQRGYAEAEGGVFCHCGVCVVCGVWDGLVRWVAALMLYGGEARGVSRRLKLGSWLLRYRGIVQIFVKLRYVSLSPLPKLRPRKRENGGYSIARKTCKKANLRKCDSEVRPECDEKDKTKRGWGISVIISPHK
jgi:hypothetical protein